MSQILVNKHKLAKDPPRQNGRIILLAARGKKFKATVDDYGRALDMEQIR